MPFLSPENTCTAFALFLETRVELNLFLPLNFFEKEGGSNSINVIVTRSEGALARRMVAYDVIPNGSKKFFGVPEILRFPPGIYLGNKIYATDLQIEKLHRLFSIFGSICWSLG